MERDFFKAAGFTRQHDRLLAYLQNQAPAPRKVSLQEKLRGLDTALNGKLGLMRRKSLGALAAPSPSPCLVCWGARRSALAGRKGEDILISTEISD